MDTDFFLTQEAEYFKNDIEDYSEDYEGHIKFMDQLKHNINNYYEEKDKATYLNNTKNIIIELESLHNKKCDYKLGKDNCPKNIYYRKCIFFIEQELNRIIPNRKEKNIVLKEFQKIADNKISFDNFYKNYISKNLTRDLTKSLLIELFNEGIIKALPSGLKYNKGKQFSSENNKFYQSIEYLNNHPIIKLILLVGGIVGIIALFF